MQYRFFRFGTFLAFLGVYLSVSLIGVGIGVLFLSGLIFFLMGKNRTWIVQHPLAPAIFLLSGAIILSIALSDPYPYLKPLEKVGYLLTIFPMTALFVAYPQDKDWILKISVVLPFMLGLLATGQVLGLLQNLPSFLNAHLKLLPGSNTLYLATGFTFHHTPFGASMTWLFHIVLAHALFEKRRNLKLLFLSSAFFALLAAFLCFSRGVWLSLSLSTFFILLLISWKWVLWASSLVISTVLLLVTYTKTFRERLYSMRPEANQERFSLWRIGWGMFKDSPWFGQGYHSFSERLDRFTNLHRLNPEFPKDSHNMYLDFLSSTGVVGFSSFVFFNFSVLRMFGRIWPTLKNSSPEKPWIVGISGGFTAFLIAGFFDRHFYMAQTLVPNLVFLSIGSALVISSVNLKKTNS